MDFSPFKILLFHPETFSGAHCYLGFHAHYRDTFFKNYFPLIVNIITFPFISMVEICSPIGKCGSGK